MDGYQAALLLVMVAFFKLSLSVFVNGKLIICGFFSHTFCVSQISIVLSNGSCSLLPPKETNDLLAQITFIREFKMHSHATRC